MPKSERCAQKVLAACEAMAPHLLHDNSKLCLIFLCALISLVPARFLVILTPDADFSGTTTDQVVTRTLDWLRPLELGGRLAGHLTLTPACGLASFTPAYTANRPVNAIPYVVAARPGILSTTDLPPITPAGPRGYEGDQR